MGQRHLFIRMAGCNLRCRYCDTPGSLERTRGYTLHGRGGGRQRYPNPVSAIDLAQQIERLLRHEAPIDAIALTGGEPLTQSEFLSAFLRAGRFPVWILLETSGALPHRLPDLLPLVNVISMDVKLPSNTGEKPLWEAHAEFLRLSRAKDLYAKLLVDQTTTDQDVERAATLLAPIRPAVPTFMQPIVDVAGRPLIDSQRLTHLYVLARRQLDAIRVLPQIHKALGLR
ncbi:MAG: 7-carboxy-7-deazaguanine synthase QueE [Candidatus Binatia bacterium]